MLLVRDRAHSIGSKPRHDACPGRPGSATTHKRILNGSGFTCCATLMASPACSFVTAAPAESSAVGGAGGGGGAGSYATARQLPPGYAETFATATPVSREAGGVVVSEAPGSGAGSFATAMPADQSVMQVPSAAMERSPHGADPSVMQMSHP